MTQKEESKESLDELLQKNCILNETIAKQDHELSDLENRLQILRANYNTQQNEINDYRNIVKKMQNQLLILTEKNIPRKPKLDLMSPGTPSRIGKLKPEDILKQDENGFVEIQFDPKINNIEIKEDLEVFIVSEFTGWNPEKMKLELKNGKQVFTGKYKLEPGFKHKFRFLVNENIISDMSLPKISNSAGHSYNYCIVQKSGDSPIPPLILEKNISYINPAVFFQ